MQSSSSTTATLILEDGTVFKGKAAGKVGTTTGEICFNTGMTGYQEVFTDPSYFGQVMVTTNVHIGNYGSKKEESESNKIQIAGLICKDFNDHYSRALADDDIQNYFEDENIVVIHGLDTRAIVKRIRSKGAMNALISSEDKSDKELLDILKAAPSMEGLELASKVSTNEAYELGDPHAEVKIAVLDFGTKNNILKCFVDRGCRLKVFPAQTKYEELKAWKPNGYFLSNGPGDPAPMDYAISCIQEILKENKPTFGICLGHQLLALALGLKTYKLHHGHRGINHPVKNLVSGYCEITSQNHGFGVDKASILENQDQVEITHMNLNDDTVEGIKVKGKNAFSIQYHPESSPGPHDSRYLFDDFIELIKSQNS